jgi:vesicle-fusing ATPase
LPPPPPPPPSPTHRPSEIPAAVEALCSTCGRSVPIKKLLLWVEMARQEVEEGDKVPLARWQQTLRDLSS